MTDAVKITYRHGQKLLGHDLSEDGVSLKCEFASAEVWGYITVGRVVAVEKVSAEERETHETVIYYIVTVWVSANLAGDSMRKNDVTKEERAKPVTIYYITRRVRGLKLKLLQWHDQSASAGRDPAHARECRNRATATEFRECNDK